MKFQGFHEVNTKEGGLIRDHNTRRRGEPRAEVTPEESIQSRERH